MKLEDEFGLLMELREYPGDECIAQIVMGEDITFIDLDEKDICEIITTLVGLVKKKRCS